MWGFYVGTAGWSIPKSQANDFPETGTHLSRYSARLPAVEINSSFYRDHQAKTYARWATTTPEPFRFSVKVARRFTHEKRLAVSPLEVRDWLLGVCELGEKLGVLLIQLPPSLALAPAAEGFFAALREHFDGNLVLEPRHPSWTKPEALELFRTYQISKVTADPERCPVQESRAWEPTLAYYRLHGSPEIYKSRYDFNHLQPLAQEIREKLKQREAWCIFDNTTYGHAWTNALELEEIIQGEEKRVDYPYAYPRRPEPELFSPLH